MNSIETGPGLQSGQEILDEVILSSVFAYSQFFWYMLAKEMWKSYFALQWYAWACLQNHFPFPNTDIRPASATGTCILHTCRLCALHVCCFLCGAFECRAIQGRYSKLVVLVSISWFRIDWWLNIFTLTFRLQPSCAFTNGIVAQLLKMLLNRIYSTFCVSNVSFVRTHFMLFISPHTARNSFVSSLIARIIN